MKVIPGAHLTGKQVMAPDSCLSWTFHLHSLASNSPFLATSRVDTETRGQPWERGSRMTHDTGGHWYSPAPNLMEISNEPLRSRGAQDWDPLAQGSPGA